MLSKLLRGVMDMNRARRVVTIAAIFALAVMTFVAGLSTVSAEDRVGNTGGQQQVVAPTEGADPTVPEPGEPGKEPGATDPSPGDSGKGADQPVAPGDKAGEDDPALKGQGEEQLTAPVAPQAEPLCGYSGEYGAIEALIWDDSLHPNGIYDEPLILMDGVQVSLYRHEPDSSWSLVGTKASGAEPPGFGRPWPSIFPPWPHGWVGWDHLPTRCNNTFYVDYKLVMTPKAGYYPTGGTVRYARLWNTEDPGGHFFCYWKYFYLTAGSQADRAFSLAQGANIHGYKFADLNGNQVFDGSDYKLGGVTILLKKDGQVVDQAVTSHVDGSYQFFVEPGSYVVEEDLSSLPPGWTNTTPVSVPATVGAGQAVEVIFGNKPPGLSISGYKWEDLNGDGSHDGSEPGVPNITILLYRWVSEGVEASEPSMDVGSWELVGSDVTGPDGSYSFYGLAPGYYRVVEQLTSPWYKVWPDDVTLMLMENSEVVNFLNARPGTITGHKWEDLNGDGQPNGSDPGVPGVRIELWRNEDGNLVFVEYVITSGDGSFQFTGVPAGSYLVIEKLTGNWYPVWSDQLTVNLSSNGSGTANFLNARPGSISGHKWLDLDGDGVHDSGEPGLGNVTITLKGGGLQTSVLTKSDGSYLFDGLEPGTYEVAEIVPANMVNTSPVSRTVQLGSGEAEIDVDFLNAVVQTGGEVVTPPRGLGGADHLPRTGLETGLQIFYFLISGLFLLVLITLIAVWRTQSSLR